MTCHLERAGINTLKAQFPKIELLNENVNDSDRVIFSNEVLQLFWE